METHRNIASGFHFYFNLFMVVLYAFAGIIVIFAWRPENFPVFNLRVIGLTLMLYAAFRARKLFRSKKVKQERSNELL